MTVNTAFRRARNVDFVEFFLNAAAVAGRKFCARDQYHRRGKVRIAFDRDRILSANFERPSRPGGVMKHYRFEQKRNIAEAGFRSAIDGETFRPFELAVDERNVDLEREAAVNLVTGDELSDRTVLVLPGWI